ncbi:aminotransferase class III-fold pyridoxal phosphate-dependent enzyme [Halosquirtibacter laminarini]|uniref:Aminotransferase class III-fold pyridoxal phosphate-dependent enzyme n=1 Tax=Halosquirtibacter laminarini TaxID=3374600 RepID=A0AC61NH86_9BACT|nr:aminotransferase class III-fold pyridoxal phosphate-dependent enzyme [Prolixibacteraceae bacterium]
MKLFDVYSLFDITPVQAKNCTITDSEGTQYLDLYGGHAVISIGHSHPHYVEMLQNQIQNIGFYSNSVQNPLQNELADKLGAISGYDDFELFLTNSGAESVENALKLASFHTGNSKVISFDKSFHGRTSAAVAVTDNPNIIAPINAQHQNVVLPLNDIEAVKEVVSSESIAAIIVEGIQGIGGIRIPETAFLEELRNICDQNNIVLILDEIQSGFGRSGKFFAHQYSGIKPDIITMAKGMGNGFPVGGILIAPNIKAKKGMLGTTFGGNYLACAATIAVMDVMQQQDLIHNAKEVGDFLMEKLQNIDKIKEVRGEGLMIGIEMNQAIAPIRQELLKKHHIFTGVSGQNIIRLLPPLTLTKEEATLFIDKLIETLESY